MKCMTFLVAVCLLVAIVPAQDVMISEIMYNPNSNESSPNAVEFLEVFNFGTAPVDMTGWYFQDEDGASAAFPNPTIIAPGEAIVFCPDLLSVADFQAAWGTGFQVVPLGGFYFGSATGIFATDIGGLSNSPSATNEMLELVDATNTSVDMANYDDASPWPSDSPDGSSIYVTPQYLNKTANDNGANWARSTSGTDGAFAVTNTGFFNGMDVASPGTVSVSLIPPFGIDISFDGMTNSVDIEVVGGTPGNFYQFFAAFTSTGVAPNGAFFGIDVNFSEINQQLLTAPFFGGLDSQGAFLLSIPAPAPLGIAIDYVCFDMSAGLAIVDVTPAVAGGF